MSGSYKDVQQHRRKRCYFCGSEGPIETHHIVPKRHGGSDNEKNLVDLCPTCHERLERLYNKDFYNSLGVEKVEEKDDQSEDMENVLCDTTRRNKNDPVHEIINELCERNRAGAPEEMVYEKLSERLKALNPDSAKAVVDKLRKKGEVYEPKQGHFRSTK